VSSSSIRVPFDERESLRRAILASAGLHALLAAAVAATGLMGLLRSGPGWGNPNARGVRVNAVAALPGIPLPSPQITTSNTLATENPSLHKAEPKPREKPPADAQEIPKFQETTPPPPAVRVNKRIQKEEVEPPPNAVRSGEGGRPSMSYSTAAAGGTSLSFGEGDFGQRYGWYVQAVRNRISSNWLTSTLSPNMITSHKVYVEFDIRRDGTITDVKLAESSGIPELDRTGLRAVYASNPLGPLPPDYSGDRVTVNVYFDPLGR
jgi:periplasmic protein TonB